MLLQTSIGLCQSAEQTPQGPPIVSTTQMRVTGLMSGSTSRYRVDARGRTARRDAARAHVRDLIEQVLFTAPGERVNRPDVRQRAAAARLRAGTATRLATATQLLVQGALQQWLGELIEVEAVEVDAATAHADGHGPLPPCARTGERRRRHVRSGARDACAALPARNPGALAGRGAAGRGQRDRLPRGARLLGTARRLRQRTLLVHCLRRRRRLDWTGATCGSTGGVRDRRRRGRSGRRSGPAPTEAAAGRRRRAGADRRGRRDAWLVVLRRPARRLLDLHAAARRRAHGRRPPPASTRCCRDGRRSRSRSTARAIRLRRTDTARTRRRPPPPIDYLAKDYASFRRLMLDRLALLVPDWRERNPADLGVALVELLAYAGDHSATSRTPSRPRPTSARPAARRRCAATRGCSTTGCTTAATPAPGCARASDDGRGRRRGRSPPARWS